MIIDPILDLLTVELQNHVLPCCCMSYYLITVQLMQDPFFWKGSDSQHFSIKCILVEFFFFKFILLFLFYFFFCFLVYMVQLAFFVCRPCSLFLIGFNWWKSESNCQDKGYLVHMFLITAVERLKSTYFAWFISILRNDNVPLSPMNESVGYPMGGLRLGQTQEVGICREHVPNRMCVFSVWSDRQTD